MIKLNIKSLKFIVILSMLILLGKAVIQPSAEGCAEGLYLAVDGTCVENCATLPNQIPSSTGGLFCECSADSFLDSLASNCIPLTLCVPPLGFLSEDGTQCLTSCSDRNQYISLDGQSCSTCSQFLINLLGTNCVTRCGLNERSVGTGKKCTCSSTSVLALNGQECVARCPIGSSKNSQGQCKCAPQTFISIDQTSCISKAKCTELKGFTVEGQQRCYQSCGQIGYFQSVTPNLCVSQCNINGEIAQVISLNNLQCRTQCDANQVLTQLSVCQCDGTSKINFDGKTCVVCSSIGAIESGDYCVCGQGFIIDESGTKCIALSDCGFIDSSGSLCLNNCASVSQYLNQNTNKCVKNCSSIGKFLNEVENQCIDCTGLFFNSDRTKCIERCSGPLSSDGKACLNVGQNCPPGQILNLAGNQCIASCPSTQFSNVDNTRCVSSCTIFNLEKRGCLSSCSEIGFLNNDGNGCLINCKTAKLVINKSGNQCISACPSTQALNSVGNQCVRKCVGALPLFSLGGKCVSSCEANTKFDADGICSCLSTLVLSLDGTTCISSCPPGQTSVGNQCKSCVSPCVNCNGSITKCTSCIPGYLINTATGVCSIINCGIKDCTLCLTSITCGTCTSPSIINSNKLACCKVLNCLNCIQDRQDRCQQCSPPFYPGSLGTCVLQPQACNILNCAQCSTQLNCVSCRSGFTLLNTQCVPVLCNVIGCQVCVTGSTSACAICISPLSLNNGRCVTALSLPAQTTCVTTNCASCVSNVCRGCFLPFVLTTAGTCVLETLNSCLIPGCATCVGYFNCLSCFFPYTISPDRSSCRLSCFIPNCLLCSTQATSTSLGVCQVCESGYAVTGLGVSCTKITPTCSVTNCLTCSGTTCTACLPGLVISNGACIPITPVLCNTILGCSTCGPNTLTNQASCNTCRTGLAKINNDNRVCAPCVVRGCSLCANGSPNICLICSNTATVTFAVSVINNLNSCVPLPCRIVNCRQCTAGPTSATCLACYTPNVLSTDLKSCTVPVAISAFVMQMDLTDYNGQV